MKTHCPRSSGNKNAGILTQRSKSSRRGGQNRAQLTQSCVRTLKLIQPKNRLCAESVDAAGDGDAGLAEGVGDLRFAEARGVVFKRQLLFGIVEAEAAQAVGVGEFAELEQLILAQRRLEFIGDFDEGHGGIIPAPGGSLNTDVTGNHLI